MLSRSFAPLLTLALAGIVVVPALAIPESSVLFNGGEFLVNSDQFECVCPDICCFIPGAGGIQYVTLPAGLGLWDGSGGSCGDPPPPPPGPSICPCPEHPHLYTNQ